MKISRSRFFSLEMGKHQLVERFLCSRSGIDSQLVRKGMLSTDQMAELTRNRWRAF